MSEDDQEIEKEGILKKKMGVTYLIIYCNKRWLLSYVITLFFLLFYCQFTFSGNKNIGFEIPEFFDGAPDFPVQYVENVENDSIDWKGGGCDDEGMIDQKENKRMAYKCKVVDDKNGFFTYLMDTNGYLVRFRNFYPTHLISINNEQYGIILSSHPFELFIEIDVNGVFKRYYAADNEFLLKNQGLEYPGVLVWYSRSLHENKCIVDFLKKYGKNIDEWSYLNTNSYSQIQMSVLHGFDEKINLKSILSAEIDKVIAFQYPNLISINNDVSSKDYRERLFVFLAANSPDSDFLKDKVEKYKDYIGHDVLGFYKEIKYCNQEGEPLWRVTQQN